MKNILTFLVLVALLGTVRAEETVEKTTKYRGEILRSVSGSVLNEKGFSSGTEKLTKGESFPVVSQTLADVTLDVGGKTVRVAKSDVLITEDTGSAEGGNFVRIVSAKYGLPEGTKWEVKEEVKKLMPPNPLTKPAQIPVTDSLLRSKAGTMVSVKIVNGQKIISQRNDASLKITYEVDGVRKEKTVMEGGTLTLP
jgi:hypothetical protein